VHGLEECWREAYVVDCVLCVVCCVLYVVGCMLYVDFYHREPQSMRERRTTMGCRSIASPSTRGSITLPITCTMLGQFSVAKHTRLNNIANNLQNAW
jgi:hypothetical protein